MSEGYTSQLIPECTSKADMKELPLWIKKVAIPKNLITKLSLPKGRRKWIV